MKNVFQILLLLLIPLIADAVDISGYYEFSLTGEAFDELRNTDLYNNRFAPVSGWETIYWNRSKLRLDIQSGGADNELMFNANLNFLATPGRVSMDLLRYAPKSFDDRQGNQRTLISEQPPENEIKLDNACLTWRKGSWRVRAGRQQLSWGPGYMYNPTDLFHLKNAVDPTYEKEGVSALRIDYNWGIGGQFTAVAVPYLPENRVQYAFRIASYLESLDFDAGVTFQTVRDRNFIFLDPVIPFVQSRKALGVELNGTVLGLGTWLEGNYNWMEYEDDFLRVLVGSDYTLINGLYMMAELLYNGRGTSTSPYTPEDWLSYILAGEPLGEYLGMVGIKKDMTSLVDVSGYIFINADGTCMLNPRLDFSVAQNTDLTVFGTGSFGNDDGQFHRGYYSAFGRVTVYF